MINSNAELSRAIRNRSSEYTIEEIFSSRYLASYISGVITGMCEHLDRHPYLTIEYNPRSNETACTDGCEVYCNSASPLIRELKTPYRMFVSLFGHCSHETAHYLYTDFIHLNPLRKQWQIGTFDYYPCLPKTEGAQEFKDYLNSHPNYRMLYTQDMATLVNVLEDVFIENMCRAEFAGLATIGLQVVNDEKYRLFPYEEDLFQRVLDNQLTPLNVAIGLIQMMKLGYKAKSNGKTTKEQQMVKDFIHSYIDDINDEIETLSWETNGLVRAKLFNEIFVKLQGLLPRPKDEQDYQCMPMGSGEPGSEQEDGENKEEQSNDSPNSQKPSDNKGKDDKKEDTSGSSGKSSDRDFSDEEKEKLSNNSSGVSEETGITKEAKGSTSPANTGKPDKEKAEAEKESAKEAASSEKTLEDIFNDAKKKIAEEETLSEDEAKHLKELEKEATEINNHSKKVDNAYFNGFQIYRESYTNAINYKNEYDVIYSEVANEAKSLARKINNILKDDSLIEEYESGYMFGSRMNTKDLYRQDGKAFSRLNNPGETKRIVMSLLIDESGSMHSGNKSIKARRAAILMEDALRRINIPLFVVGHTENNDKVILKPYVDPETNDNRDKYRLSGITAYSGNIDGAAIHYMKEKLLKRPEEVKVLIVISDGLPAGTSFYSKDQREDTKLAVKDARRNGIKVFGAVVDDFEDVASLYDAAYCFDCSSGRMLEKTLCMLIKKYVLINQ